MTNTSKSAVRMAIIEFPIVFAGELAWNFFRETGQSLFDAFGIALITALFLYLVQRPLE
jgi:hypothetical protein